MADPVLRLLVLSFFIAISSFVAGIAPLSFPLSARNLRYLTSLGSGLLIGTALSVLIPEGADLMYATPHGGGHGDERSDDGHAHSGSRPAIILGLVLLLGFATMWLLDTLMTLPAPAPHRPTTPHSPDDEPLVVFHTSASSASLHSESNWATSHDHSKLADDDDDGGRARAAANDRRRALAATLALSAHSFTDGVALGTTALAPSHVGFTIFLALALHRAPAAVGLAAALLRLGVSRRAARAHLAAFSLAALAGSLASWLIVSVLSGVDGRRLEDADERTFGPVLAFSGATFLYVAMHTLQASEAVATGKVYSRILEACCTVAGMFLPLGIQTVIGHSHTS